MNSSASVGQALRSCSSWHQGLELSAVWALLGGTDTLSENFLQPARSSRCSARFRTEHCLARQTIKDLKVPRFKFVGTKRCPMRRRALRPQVAMS